MSNIKIKIMDNFEWTDEAVKSFTQVYSSNFNSKLVNFPCNYKDYSGKNIHEKMEQFKLDYKPQEKVTYNISIKTVYGNYYMNTKDFNNEKHFENWYSFMSRKGHKIIGVQKLVGGQVCHLKAVRVSDYDMVGDKHYGDRPYGVCLDVYDSKGNFVENGTDWSYFATEQEADEFVKEYNQQVTRLNF